MSKLRLNHLTPQITIPTCDFEGKDATVDGAAVSYLADGGTYHIKPEDPYSYVVQSCSTSSPTVTALAGHLFDSGLVGLKFYISDVNGTPPYTLLGTVLSVAGDGTTLTLTSNSAVSATFKYGAYSTGGTIPVKITRPATDDLFVAGSGPYIQMMPWCRGFDSIDQRMYFDFWSDVAGEAYVDLYLAYFNTASHNGAGVWSGYGRCTGAAINSQNWYDYYIKASLNGVTAGGTVNNLTPADHNIVRGGAVEPYFRWEFAASNASGGGFTDRQRFQLKRGVNRITVDPGQYGVGVIIEAAHVTLCGQRNHLLPRCFKHGLSPTINLGAALAKIGSSPCNVAVHSDSIGHGNGASGHGVLTLFRNQIHTKFPITAVAFRLGTTAAGTFDGHLEEGVYEIPGTETLTIDRTSGGGAGIAPLHGLSCYKWTSGQTGSLSMLVPGNNSHCRVIFACSANSGKFTIQIKDALANGTAGGDVYYSGPIDTSHPTKLWGSFDVGVLPPIGDPLHPNDHLKIIINKYGSDADGVTLAYLVTGTSPNNVWFRMTEGGMEPATVFPANKLASWADLHTAIGTNLVITEYVNWLGSTGIAYDMVTFAACLERAMPAITRNGSAQLLMTTWFDYGPITISSGVVEDNYAGKEIHRHFIDRNALGYLYQNISVLDLESYIGYPNLSDYMYYQPLTDGGQTVNGVTFQGYEVQSSSAASGHGTWNADGTGSYPALGGLAGDLFLGNVPASASSGGGGGGRAGVIRSIVG